jgi:hypothetical protein
MAQSTYQAMLQPWAIYRRSGAVSNIFIARFRSRSDAEGHLMILRQNIPDARFEVVFEAPYAN